MPLRRHLTWLLAFALALLTGAAPAWAERGRAWLAPKARAAIAKVKAKAGGRTAGAVVFDGDGTLWGGDVGLGFFTWMLKHQHYPAERRNRLGAAWRDYQHGALDSVSLYNSILTGAAGMSAESVDTLGRTYVRDEHAARIYAPMRRLALELKELRPWIVSGSPKPVVGAAAGYFGIPRERVIALETKVDRSGRLTDEIVTPIPWAEGKAQRILAEVMRGPRDRPEIVAGDSTGDIAMLRLGRFALVINPVPELEAMARARGWPIHHLGPADELRPIRRGAASSRP